MSKSADTKLEYNWEDIQLAQKTGFEECKQKVLEILKNGDWSNFIHELVIEEIEKL